ncbi:family 20 glycosylhydrolase [Carboxylicivirga sp. N1Y90]|uniref:family 20 glycosylhydrolase n=1 Tax=Carboxylicivirga fragile TaxID=3417571 RepID=UPI003D340C0C|nr:family 20 glycosylhydrolase [Marinilabiliaceae bacterium N1Y90]
MRFKSISIFILCIGLYACQSEEQSLSISIVPQVEEITNQDGHFELTKSTSLFVNNESINTIAELIQNKFKTVSGDDISIVNEKPKTNYISFELNKDLKLKEEAYQLKVEATSVNISASSKSGLFYGLQTLLQLLPPQIENPKYVHGVKWQIPCVTINDAPRFPWRGMHLDVCRHFVPVENIKKHLDMMAMFKMNTFHWHLTEDQAWRIEIKKYPLLTEIGSKRIEGDGSEYGGFYTQQEVKEIVAYAAERFITVVPEIELPGHALAALTAYPEYSCTGGPFIVRNTWGVEPDVYCAGREETFAFLADIIDEVVELFPSPYFHIGGDECPKERWEECKHCQARIKNEGLKDTHELQSYFIKRIEKVLLAHDKKMIGWDEILEGGLAKSAAVMSWRGEKGGIDAAAQGHDIVMTPGNWCYLDHYQGDSRVEPVAIGGYTTLEETYSYEPVPEQLQADMAHHVLGTQGNVWSEYMYTPELVEYRVYPRIIALAEVNWSQKSKKDYADFVQRLNAQFIRMDAHNINYHIPLAEGPVNKMVYENNIKVNFSNTRDLKMVYTTDGTKPSLESSEYKNTLLFAEDKTIKIACVLPTGKMGPYRTIELVQQDKINALDVTTTQIGLQEQFTKGRFIGVEEIVGIKDWETRHDSMSVVKGKKRDGHENPSASIYTGYIEIPEDGIYEFETNLDQFFIAEQLLIDNDKEVKRFSRNNSTINLSKGKHPVKLIYLNNNIGGFPQAWNGPKVSFRLWGAEKFTTATPQSYSY